MYAGRNMMSIRINLYILYIYRGLLPICYSKYLLFGSFSASWLKFLQLKLAGSLCKLAESFAKLS